MKAFNSVDDYEGIPNSRMPVGPLLKGEKVQYWRHEPFGGSEQRMENLLIFVHDVPHMDVCGIFPPHTILNQILAQGGGDGGMGPGASWKPFSIDARQYEKLKRDLETVDLDELARQARYHQYRFHFDPSLDEVKEWHDWVLQVSEKHLDSFQKRLERSGAGY